ncbi:Glycosyltransferase involved in cell wall bisynthesis [Lutibacter agarilyticus]|uniref:Glycosyltransferase involved in cell wall bisynthesis n=1 Tax=Lutibacter agarilyticus TaxID=1109740 RepID=A0A238YZB9_9FLAO|nr:glycosyltransferase family 2 protein [Lutibacter agarilyticus]SNR75983.1 Glycosyltransferase involved in cell wall bisynthesis [Lutibacter agarilyticus]
MCTAFVSIIIPTFNRCEFLRDTLKSVEKQIHTNWECIVVDDGSNDNTEKIVNVFSIKDTRFKFFRRPLYLNKGANSCRNYGYEKSLGEYINWFDDDDIMLPNFIKDKLDSIVNDKQNMIIASGYSANEYLKCKKEISIKESENSLYKNYVLEGVKILTPSVLFRKEFLDKHDLFLDVIKKGQEFELFSRLFFKIDKHEYKIIQSYGFLYRGHLQSTSSKAKFYRKDFQESSSYIVKGNLVRAINLNDSELIQSSYRMLLNLYRKALINEHNYNIIYIEKVFQLNLIKRKIIIMSCLKLIKFFRIQSFRWDKVLNKIRVH